MSIHDLPVKSVLLDEILQKRNVTRREIEGCLTEFVIKSWKEGKSVREWCEDIQRILEVIQVTHILLQAFQTSCLRYLLPFVEPLPNIYNPTIEPPFPPPLLPKGALLKITRDQLIETLCRLSKENCYSGSRPFCDEPLIYELCLSYISTIWRKSKLDNHTEDHLIDWISKDMTEIEFEIQLQVSTVQNFRLSSIPTTETPDNNETSTTHPRYGIPLSDEKDDPKQLEIIIRAWVVRRLSIGIQYSVILAELANIKCRIEDSDLRQLVDEVLESEFGVSLVQRSSELSTQESGLLWSSPSSPSPISDPINSTANDKPLGLYPQLCSSSTPSILNFTMGRKRAFNPHTPKWSYHKRNNSSSSKLRSASDHSRPSSSHIANDLIPESSGSMQQDQSSHTSAIKMNNFTYPTTEGNLRQSIISISSERRRTNFEEALTSSLMSLTDKEDIRTVLLNQLMEMRYHIHGHEDEGWFLGGGREQAEELLSQLERKMIGKKDLMDLKEVFKSMRSAFDLPPFIDPIRVHSKISSRSRPNTMRSSIENRTISQLPNDQYQDQSQRESLDLDTFLDEVARLPDTIEHPSSEKNAEKSQEKSQQTNQMTVFEENTTANQQEIMLSRSTTPSNNNKPLRAQSVLTMASLFTTDSQDEQRLSNYEIQEAHREYQVKSKAVEYHFPPSTPPAESANKWELYKRGFASEPDLTEIDGKYTRLPPKISTLRRNTTRISKTMSRLTAKDLGLTDIPYTPQSFALPIRNTDNQDKENEERIYEPSSVLRSESISHRYATSTSDTEDSPSKSTFDTHIVTPTTMRHPYPNPHIHAHNQPLSTLSSQATLFSPHDTYLVTPDRRRASLGPSDKSRRQLHRHFAIFDGEQVSPSRGMGELEVDMETSLDIEDSVTPTFKPATLLMKPTSDIYSKATLSSRSAHGSIEFENTPRIRPKNPDCVTGSPLSSQSHQSNFSLVNPFSNKSKNKAIYFDCPAQGPSSLFSSKPSVPLNEVIKLLKKYDESEGNLTLWEVEDSLYNLIDIEKCRTEKSGDIWDNEKKGNLKWLIEQVAIMLGNPVYVAPISRVIASLSSDNDSNCNRISYSKITSEESTLLPKTSLAFSSDTPRRPSLPRYKSQPQFSSSTSASKGNSSFIPHSPPRPEPLRPNILRRHTQSCLSITSIQSASSIYSTPSVIGIDHDTKEEIIEYDHPSFQQYDIPSPYINGNLIINEKQNQRISYQQLSNPNTNPNKSIYKDQHGGTSSIDYGYKDWNLPLPQKLEWPTPHIHSNRQRQISDSTTKSENSLRSMTSTGTFGRK
ncbi:uncharacterized protein L201_006870 [Kwoniella dendrophila CBS 6074]|uniref:Rho-GAP domain-containing protein n=1 Tax=Kwoniella dendrophila CBS 6074 TaxID=1295534 RepID=A0AAX4K598_9TREE